MRALSSPLRKQLESAVLAARRAAESASRATLDGLGVFADRRPEHLDKERAALRNGLRAKWRQFGEDRDLLVTECAYEQWHRLLFARFLAENHLLLHPQFRVPVTLADCEDLAAELGEPDGWSVAARFAAEILPGIFRLDDPCVRLRLAPEGRDVLERILAGLPVEVFLADDALGWVYQFWQKDKKDEINASERKIGGADLGPVTQLFTENYMVRFLLENSLGAWWASRHPDSPLVRDFEYLRFDDSGQPAAGPFDGWPDRVAEVTVMDPCCGSGHFLVEAFSMLWRMRAEEEELSQTETQDAVLQDNLFGLEVDPRCVEIAMFAVAQQAWKAGGEWRQLPMPNIACAGIPVRAASDEWKALGRGDERLENALVRLHMIFRQADTLGSLIDPSAVAHLNSSKGTQGSFDDLDWSEIAPFLEMAARSEASDPATAVLGADARSMVRTADYLSRSFTLVTTNVPYLGRAKQSAILAKFLDNRYPIGRSDLAIAFLIRLSEFAMPSGSIAVVAPQSWMFLRSYKEFRKRLLQRSELLMLARLGPGAFGHISGEAVNVGLGVMSVCRPQTDASVSFLDVEDPKGPLDKALALKQASMVRVTQASQMKNPMAMLNGLSLSSQTLVGDVAVSFQGTSTGDAPRFLRKFWEFPDEPPEWERQQGTTTCSIFYGGRENLILWENRAGELQRAHKKGWGAIRGEDAWGKHGIALSQMGAMPCTLYSGDLFDNSSTAVIPKNPADVGSLFYFFSSDEFKMLLHSVSPKMSVEVATVQIVPFDAKRWRLVAERAAPLPEPSSENPTQWLFGGDVRKSTDPLQVAAGWLVGYKWPEQRDSKLGGPVGVHEIACLPSVAGERPAADRVMSILATAFGDGWASTTANGLLEQTGSKKQNLADWLRDEFFRQHCALFKNRPFIWHIWDGQRDGFSALVNYHRLDRRTLEKLTYTYLGQDWVERQRAGVRDEVAGAELRLSAALELQHKLEAILEGEKPYDIYVRWKPPHEQPIGWEPDLNDGVRLNIRPFVKAGVLRAPFNIHWRKDRGKNPDGSERENDIHLSLAEKRQAREEAGSV
jgi:hypothetical protein